MSQRRTTSVICVLFVTLAVAWQLRPAAPIVVLRQTTYITAPLDDEGLPDFRRYLTEKYSEGVTPENNAAVLIWQAVGPAEIPPEDREERFAAFGAEPLPDDGDYFVDPFANDSYVDRWAVMSRPWRRELMPLLADAIDENQHALDLAVEASERSRFFSPPYDGVDDADAAYSLLPLDTHDHVRDLANTLVARAMLSVSDGRFAEAQRDISAVHRLARLLGQGPTMIEYGYGAATDELASAAHVVLVSHPDVPASILETSLGVLRNFALWPNPADIADEGDRLSSLYMQLQMYRHSGILNDEDDMKAKLDQTVMERAFDWNVMLRRHNEVTDALVAAMRIEDRQLRSNTFAEIGAELDQRAVPSYWRGVGAVFGRRARSEIIADMSVSMLNSGLHQAILHTQERANMQLDLASVSAALALYHTQHGSYPPDLNQLAPDLLDENPWDVFNGEPLHYERRGEGYLLYSVGSDEQDDGGTTTRESIVAGEWTTSENRIGQGGDLVVRVPVMPLAVPRRDDYQSDDEGDSAESSTGFGEADALCIGPR